MEFNKQLIETFYTAFSKRDYAAMANCYSDDIVFNDPAFGLLQGDEAKYMWEMLCKSSNDLKLEFGNITAVDEEYYNCDWTAYYTFSKTGNKVVNKVKAYMRLKDGKIIEHSDAFRFSTWAGQALGWKGKLLGWTNFMKRKVRNTARKSLVAFIEKKNSNA